MSYNTAFLPLVRRFNVSEPSVIDYPYELDEDKSAPAVQGVIFCGHGKTNPRQLIISAQYL